MEPINKLFVAMSLPSCLAQLRKDKGLIPQPWPTRSAVHVNQVKRYERKHCVTIDSLVFDEDEHQRRR